MPCFFNVITLPYLVLFIASCQLSVTSFSLNAKELNQMPTQTVAPLIVRYNQSTLLDDNEKYYVSLLKLALNETIDDFGPYQLQSVNINMVQQRSINMLGTGKYIDVIWSMTSSKREQTLQAVYIPLLKGLMGYRVFLIRADEQNRFSDINTIEELNSMVAGQGAYWPDTEILKANGVFNVDALEKYLHSMLVKRRFDYFPRAITEVATELVKYPMLALESQLMFKYTAPSYFFVNEKNTVLAERLELGLMRAIKNGSFDRLFYDVWAPAVLMTQLNIVNRLVFPLKNPLLSEKSKQLQANKSSWFFPN